MPLDGRPLREFIGPTWDILTSRAPGGASISYGDLVEELIGKRIRFPDQAVRPVLDFLCGYCVGTGAPPLSVLVVNVQSQEPGPGFQELVPDIEIVKRDVRNYNWGTHPPPIPQSEADPFNSSLTQKGRRGWWRRWGIFCRRH